MVCGFPLFVALGQKFDRSWTAESSEFSLSLTLASGMVTAVFFSHRQSEHPSSMFFPESPSDDSKEDPYVA